MLLFLDTLKPWEKKAPHVFCNLQRSMGPITLTELTVSPIAEICTNPARVGRRWRPPLSAPSDRYTAVGSQWVVQYRGGTQFSFSFSWYSGRVGSKRTLTKWSTEWVNLLSITKQIFQPLVTNFTDAWTLMGRSARAYRQVYDVDQNLNFVHIIHNSSQSCPKNNSMWYVACEWTKEQLRY